MENVISIEKEIQALGDELQGLRRKLENETSSTAQLRAAYDSECLRVPVDGGKLMAAKLHFDTANLGIDRIKGEIAKKERLLDEAQGREAEENHRRHAQQDFERASHRLTVSQAEIAKLRAEFSALPAKIRTAELYLNQALRDFNEAKQSLRIFVDFVSN